MRLERIKIEGYRSIRSVEWRPSMLNVLIGPNASGKSNFLHALELLPAAAAGELRETILRRGGMVPLLWNGSAREINLELHTCGVQFEFVNLLDYQLTLSQMGNSGAFEITREQLGRGSEGVVDRTDLVGGIDPTTAVVSIFHYKDDEPADYMFRPYLNAWSIYHDLRVDQAAPVRQSAVTRFEKRLDPDGQNLVPVLHTLYETDRTFEERIDDAMSAAFPGAYEKLKFSPLEDGRTQLRLRWKRSGRLSNAADLSDGTLRFLMLLTILGSPDPAPLIAIDEPETGIHPGMLPILAEFAAEASKQSQVILSTHSPQFLDAFRDTLPAVTVFQWVEDHTELKTLAGDELKKWVEDYSLGKFCFSGEAEAIS